MTVHATMNMWPVSSLVNVLACPLFGDKPLPEAMMTFYQLALKQQISMTINLKKIYKKIYMKMSPMKYPPFGIGHNMLQTYVAYYSPC